MYYGYGYGYGKAKKQGAGYDPVAVAYFTAAPFGHTDSEKVIINRLIAGLRTDGNLTKLDRLWLFANNYTQNAVIDVIGLTTATLVNSPAFAASQGYSTDGGTKYINTNFNPATQGVNFTLNSASFGVYSRTETSAIYYSVGGNNATPVYNIINQRRATNTFVGAINSLSFESWTNTSGLGLVTISRTGVNATEGYARGVSIGTGTTASSAIPSVNHYVGGRNNNGTLANQTAQQFSIVYFGSGSINQATLYNRIQQYMTDLGTQV